MPGSHQSSLPNGSESVSQWVTDKHSQWSDSGPIKIDYCVDISLNIKMFLTHHWPPYPTLISQPIGLMTSFPASVLAHKFLEKYSTICLSGNSVSANKVQQWNPQKEESTFLCVYVTSFQPGAQCPKEVEVTQSADIIDWPTWGRGVDAYFLFSDDSVSQGFLSTFYWWSFISCW